MKKIIYVLLLLSFFACSKVGGSTDESVNPLAECVCPLQVHAGGEGVIQWNGFESDDRLCLTGKDGIDHQLQIKVITESGLIFLVPGTTPAADYVIILLRSERKELGQVKVLEQTMPVTGLKLPSESVAGDSFMISGLGFEQGCEVVFVDASGEEYHVESQITYDGMNCMIPEDFPVGEYKVFLKQNGVTWLLADSFDVINLEIVKSLKELRYYAPYMSNSKIMLSWVIDNVSPVSLTLTEYIVDGEKLTQRCYDKYEDNGTGCFELINDGFEESNDLSMSYMIDSKGYVISSDVRFYGDDASTRLTWTYDSEGFLTEIATEKRSFRQLAYELGNLTLFRKTEFQYPDPEMINARNAADVVWGYMALQEYKDPFIYIPYLLGWYTKASAHLPTVMLKPAPNGTEMTSCELKYTFDSDGYVVKMSWNEGNDDYHMEFIYQ